MIRISLVLLVLVWSGILTVADPAPLSLADYKAQLEQYSADIQKIADHPEQVATLNRDVPTSLQVRTQEGTITVSMEFLRKEANRFLDATPNLRPTILKELSNRIKGMREEADRFEQARSGDKTTRERLNQVLSAREFRGVHGPTELELLEERINAWISEKLNKFFPTGPDLDQLGQVFVWIVIAIASSIFGVWLYRQSRERLLERPREILPFVPSSKSWRVWLSEARERTAVGEWREAIRLGFWAAVSHLESQGIWRPDRARTPREYLKAIPAASAIRLPFAAATKTFETAWYGGHPASAADFERFVVELEKLGCRE
ncbi:MAG: DUF4129 domain-containing protein [Terriglobales bacterium]